MPLSTNSQVEFKLLKQQQLISTWYYRIKNSSHIPPYNLKFFKNCQIPTEEDNSIPTQTPRQYTMIIDLQKLHA